MKLPKPARGDQFIPTRQSLLSRLKNWNDDASWEDFFHTYWKFIYSVALRSGLTEDEAQEVVQETIIGISKQMPAFKYDGSQGSFKGWLLRLTRWRIQDQFRRRDPELVAGANAEGGAEVPIEEVPDPNAAISHLWEEEWQRNLVEAALEKVKLQVSPRVYQIFDLYVIQQLPVQTVTARLGVNLAQVYLAKHRVMALLRKEAARLERRL